MEQKEYRPIPGHRQYAVSRDGVVIRIAGEGRKPLGAALNQSAHRTKKGSSHYLYCTMLSKDAKDAKGEIIDLKCTEPKGVHRLVALAWIGPAPDDKPWVNHKDGDKTNNHVENLEWSSISENRKHAFNTGLQRVPSGPDHWAFGKKAPAHTRAVMSAQKKGERHPKFKGWYEKEGTRYPSAREAAAKTGENARKISKHATNGTFGWIFIPKEWDVKSSI